MLHSQVPECNISFVGEGHHLNQGSYNTICQALGLDAEYTFGETSMILNLIGDSLIGNQSTVKVDVIILLKLISSLPFLLLSSVC